MKLHHIVFVAGLVGIGYFVGKEYIPQGLIPARAAGPIALPQDKQTNVTIAPVTQILDSEKATIGLFEQSAPSVCFITTKVVQTDFWSRNTEEIPAGSGSGFIWDKNGHIVTNAHVISNSSKAYVTLSDRKTYEATLVGSEPAKDLAVLKINAPAETLRPLPIGTSKDLRVGQFAMAIGNPFGLDQTLTTGVVSALGREIKSLTGVAIRGVVQTDAAINPGNSGGPLLDSNGRLIGVNTQIYSPSGASAGIGFSIPVDEVAWVVPELIKYGKVKRPALGVALLPQREAERYNLAQGAVIVEASPEGPAFSAGLKGFSRSSTGEIQVGDIIIGLGDMKISSQDDLILSLEKFKVGDRVVVKYLRDEKEKSVEVVLGELK